MFGELISFVDVLRSVVFDLRKNKLTADRDEAISKMLQTYFYLKDAVDEGEALVIDAAPNPAKLIASLSPVEARLKLLEWDHALRRQGFRLYRISENIFGQDFIEIVSPNLQEKLYEVIGSKFNRATSLHGIGAVLFFRDMFPLQNTDEEKARYISVMAGEKGNLLHMDKIKSEISALRIAMQSYREAISSLASREEIVRLSNAARSKTSLQASPQGA